MILEVTDPQFDDDNLVEYKIGSGVYSVMFRDWLVLWVENCAVSWNYMTKESVDGVITNNFSLVDPTA